jgi:LysR family hydrogen peroxide-inducible transcriptional activator
MTLTQLTYALQLREQLNFKRAAEQLSISQPALSIQIQKLEDEIGIKLFNRAGSPLEVTQDGELFLIRAQEIVTQAKKLKEFVGELKDDFTGTLNIGIIPTLAPFLVPLFSRSIKNQYPQLQLTFFEEITENVVNHVRNGAIDVGIISTPINVYGISSIPLFYERFYVYSSQGKETVENEIKIKDIIHDELWLLDEGNCFRDQINDFCDLKTIRSGKKFIYHSNSIDALIRIVDANGGMTILPELTTLSLSGEQEENLKIISGKPKAREIGMILTPNHDKERYISVLEEQIKSNIPHHMLTGDDYDIVDPHILMN